MVTRALQSPYSVRVCLNYLHCEISFIGTQGQITVTMSVCSQRAEVRYVPEEMVHCDPVSLFSKGRLKIRP